MKRRPFDLTFLRRGPIRHDAPPPEGLTRREVLSGVAAAAVVPPLLTQVTSSPGAVTVIRGSRRAALALDGTEVWSVDAARLGGHPHVTVTSTGDETVIALTGAVYPGTSLTADLRVTLYTGLTGPRLNIALALGRFKADVSARAWLRGRTVAESDVSLDARGFAAGGLRLALSGRAHASYSAAGAFHASGTGIARLSGMFDAPAASDGFSLRLASPGSASAMSRPPARRTLISLERGSQTWTGVPHMADEHPGAFAWASHPFDFIDVESALGSSGARCVAVARTGSDATVTTYTAPSPLGVGTVELPLASPRLAVSYDTGQRSMALMADFAAHTWIPLNGLSVRVGPAEGAPVFEATGASAKLTEVSCSPAITGVVPAAPDGTIIEAVLPAGRATQVAVLGDVRVPVGVKKSQTTQLTAGGGDVQASDLIIVRPDDLLVITLKFRNLKIGLGEVGAELQRMSYVAGSYVIAELPPQHLLERAFFRTKPDSGPKLSAAASGVPASRPPDPVGSEPFLARPVKALLAGKSRLAFKLPANMNLIPYRLDYLLRFDRLEPSIVPAAREYLEGTTTTVPFPASVLPASDIETSIEFPTRLHLSPNEFARWKNATQPVIADDPLGGTAKWAELWHTVASPWDTPWAADAPTNLRAVYSPDFSAGAPPAHANFNFRASLDGRDRHELVKIMGQYRLAPAVARLFALSALGGWMDLKATWDPDTYTDAKYGDALSTVEVEKWEHRATQGRDNYVKVVYSGYLFPFGHRASLVKVTERQYRSDPSTPADPGTAYLVQRMYLVVRERERDYGTATDARSRRMPFRTVRIETMRTPDIDDIGKGIETRGQQCFWPKVDGTEFAFRITATDRADRPVEFTAPLIFVSRSLALYPAGGGSLELTQRRSLLLKIRAEYLSSKRPDRRGRVLTGKVAYAPQSRDGDTTADTAAMAFSVDIFPVTEVDKPNEPRFVPRMDFALVRLPAVGEITGGKPVASVRYPAAYIDHGLADVAATANAGDVYLELLPSAQVPVGFPGDKSGGMATPSFTVSGLSRTYGTVSGDLAQFAGGDFDPSQFFDTSAKLLGGITLGELISALSGFTTPVGVAGPEAVAEIPQMKQYVDGDEKVVSYEWQTYAFNDILFFVPITGGPPEASTSLTLNAQARTAMTTPPSPPVVSINGALRNFTVDLCRPASFIRITFDSLTFDSIQGSKPTVHVNIRPGGVEFVGPLEFISFFQQYISFGGGSPSSSSIAETSGEGTQAITPANSEGGESGPEIRVDAGGVTVGYTLSIPTIAMGMWSLMDLSFSASVRLPFDGSPVRLRLAFCDRDKPFLVGVMCFAGGGFVAVGLGTDGMESLEASFEFGAQLALSLGVASGRVYARGGFYFGIKWEAVGQTLTFSAFIRLGGALEILGLITISLEFYVSLNYQKTGEKSKLWGQATLTVEVEVLFFSKSVEVTAERELAGSDPGFVDMFPESKESPGTSDVWSAYCAAFEPALLK